MCGPNEGHSRLRAKLGKGLEEAERLSERNYLAIMRWACRGISWPSCSAVLHLLKEQAFADLAAKFSYLLRRELP